MIVRSVITVGSFPEGISETFYASMCVVDVPEGLDRTYFFAAPIVRLPRRPPRRLHHFVSHPPKKEGVSLVYILAV